MTTRILIGLIVAITLASVAVAVVAAGGAPGGGSGQFQGGGVLHGGTWRWQYTLMSDSLRITPADPARYTIEFGADQSLTAQFDCNRGGGSYTTGPNRSIKIGPLISTLMGCPPPSLGDVFGRDLDRVNSYLFVDADTLVLELPLDSGAMTFKRFR